jgi:hypothetical protein
MDKMIFSWKKSGPPRAMGDRRIAAPTPTPAARAGHTANAGTIRLDHVTLPPAIQDLSLEIPLGSWLVLMGDDDFAKALFCDLCFSYINPESGRVHPVLKGSDVSFLGRTNTTYGNTLVDHLQCGVRDHSKARLEQVARTILSDRFRRHMGPLNPLEFLNGKKARNVELDERDFLEIAEANLMLQRRRAAVVDTTTDFYHIALEQGFRHSEQFLQSGKTLLWIVDDSQGAVIAESSRPWNLRREGKIDLTFPSGSRAGYIN